MVSLLSAWHTLEGPLIKVQNLGIFNNFQYLIYLPNCSLKGSIIIVPSQNGFPIKCLEYPKVMFGSWKVVKKKNKS